MATISQKPKLITIFGGNGFVGRHLVQALTKRGHRVRELVHAKPENSGARVPAGRAGTLHWP